VVVSFAAAAVVLGICLGTLLNKLAIELIASLLSLY